MTRLRKRGEKIREFIIEQVEHHPKDIIALTSETFSVSRQAVNKHIKQLIAQKALIREGKAKSVRYFLHPQSEWIATFPLADNSAEDVVWRNEIKQKIGQLSDNALGIWYHGFSEMFNNAIDHSEGTSVTINIKKTAYSTEMYIHDNGIGLFTKIKNIMGLLDERHAVIELTKGKLTTDPTRHSGEGIFFSSRMFDEYSILSGEVFLSHTYEKEEDWILETSKYQNGTFITMKLRNNTARTTQEIFNKFTDDDYGFTKTVVPVRLAQYGNEQLVSRSQAKRLVIRIDRFKTVLFDFKDVEYIGQAFADEVFRVFARLHPTMEILPINGNEAVMQMIKRVELAQ
ncbi:MAG: ArsR family transcriptional regulator [Deltaproteobacteria bacterium RIFOXYD12_FULL_50_9]|nr:MAG: ArsR family transcriptional regulator [Deltaproteobacteria bacterium RIFOXYD12_FULL_50_9]